MDFEGLRADQVLTSPAFGLAGARDYETVTKQERYRRLLEMLEPNSEELLELAELRTDPAITSLPVQETVYGESLVRGVRAQLREEWSKIPIEARKREVEEETKAMDRLLKELRS
jgi:hypothetical protein